MILECQGRCHAMLQLCIAIYIVWLECDEDMYGFPKYGTVFQSQIYMAIRLMVSTRLDIMIPKKYYNISIANYETQSSGTARREMPFLKKCRKVTTFFLDCES